VSFNINLFQGALKLGGARSSLFQVNITNPVNGSADIQVPFLVRAASIPAGTMGVIEQPYFGRNIKLAGSRTFEEWSVTVLNDEDYAIRNALEQWQNSINGPETNLTNLGSSSPALYKSTAQVTQFSKTGVPLRVYSLIGIFPLLISAIDLDWTPSDAVQEFQCTFAVDYAHPTGGITGLAGT